MNKKGVSPPEMMVMLLLTIAVASAILFVGYKLSDPDAVIQKNVMNGVKLTAESLAAVSGNAVVELPYDGSDYGVVLRPGEVEVVDEEGFAVKDALHLQENIVAAASVKGVERLCLTKEKNFISIRECSETEVGNE